MNQNDKRNQLIIRTSIIGILANLLLSVFKAIVGTLTNSIAITLDAVNNLSDAASSIITIVGTKLASRPADRTHPFGHGRAEYLSAMAISGLILYAGITSLVESIKKIISPQTPDYTSTALLIVAVAVIVKIILGIYVKSTGKKARSDSLVNSGSDALLDAVISASTLIAAVIYILRGISLEAYLAAVISVIIIKAGFDMLRETISRLLGERADLDLMLAVKKTVLEFDGVYGVYDLVISDFGPNEFRGSLHIEVQDTCTANELDSLIRSIQAKVMEEHHIILSAIGVYSINTKDPYAIQIREELRKIVTAHKHINQMHGFYLNQDDHTIRFDMVMSFDEEDRAKLYQEVLTEIQAIYPDYTFNVALDIDLMES